MVPHAKQIGAESGLGFFSEVESSSSRSDMRCAEVEGEVVL